ncbi:alpha/beta fold hydrolase [Kytococcus sedentarius]|uniref:alpha/beta fold hydrolase n=1 Tax=Kytococcus sedentarius TaxID=1276 RepID=UPI0035BC14D5
MTPLDQLPQVDPRWQHHLVLPPRGRLPGARMAVLDTHSPEMVAAGARPEDVRHVLVCVHGNPTWSYLWRRVLAQAPADWRVIAVDHVGMGHSERSSTVRRLADRTDDLDEALTQLGVLEGVHADLPVSVMVHDWGGTIGLGWAARHPERIASAVITNTALWQPDDRVPPGIRAARAAGLHRAATVDTPTFVHAAAWVGQPGPDREAAAALASPYRRRDHRRAVGEFVADIPLEADHPSRSALEAAAAGAASLDVPALVLWGAKDPVFTDRYLRDVLERFPTADVHRFGDASHLVLEDRPEGVGYAWDWLTGTAEGRGFPATSGAAAADADAGTGDAEPAPTGVIWSRLTERAEREPDALAIVELDDAGRRTVTFGELESRVAQLAAGLRQHGVGPGTRVAVLVPPGIDLTAVVYAVWRAGGSIVVADAGLGVRPMAGALRSADPDLVVGIPAGLAAARALGVEGDRIVVRPASSGAATAVAERVADADLSLDSVQEAGASHPVDLAPPAVDVEAAVLFTSGATGPPKGVVYRHRQLLAQRDVIESALELRAGESLVAAFAPFALYGPALGMTSAVPDMDVTSPDTLTAAALADAVTAVGADVVFASPAALRNVVATHDPSTPVLDGVRMVMSAGAPVPVELLERVRRVTPHAATVTPYGMTEALPLTAIDPRTVDAADLAAHAGVCVGRPVQGVELRIAPLDDAGEPGGDASLTTEPGVRGEVVARAPHVKSHYDRLWGTQRATAHPVGWHRTGDIGHLDEAGRLWIEGRGVHTVTTAAGPVAPGGVESRVERLDGVQQAAVVGVGPAGGQRVVVVVRPSEGADLRLHAGSPVASVEFSAAVREAADGGPGAAPVAAVLVRDSLPVDIRHASKIDRTALAEWATETLAGDGGSSLGDRAGRLLSAPRRVLGRLDRVGFRP